MSLQEEEARQAAATRQESSSAAAPSQVPSKATKEDSAMLSDEADDELAQALAMSRGEDVE